MKKHIIIILTIISGLGLFSSCEKDETKVFLNADATGAVLTSPAAGNDIVLTAADSASYIVFSWNAPNYGFNAAITYMLEIDKEGNNFSDPLTIISGATTTSDSIMVYNLNSKLVAKGFETDVAANAQIRIRSILAGLNSSPYADTLYSEPVTISVTPFLAVVTYPSIYAPGSYQGWTPTTANKLYSINSDGKYEGYIYFPDDETEFKFTMDATWDENYGDTGADGTLDSGGDNIVVNGTGYYKVNVNMNSLTYTITKTSWGIVGDFTGWADGADVALNYDSNTGLLTATTDITAGSIKFRANGAWDINYGDTGADGTLDSGGDNITIVTSGNYTVSLDLNGPIYSYTIVKND